MINLTVDNISVDPKGFTCIPKDKIFSCCIEIGEDLARIAMETAKEDLTLDDLTNAGRLIIKGEKDEEKKKKGIVVEDNTTEEGDDNIKVSIMNHKEKCSEKVTNV